MFCNGYNISGNLAADGRKYEVHNASGAVVQTANSKRLAIDWCEGSTAGDVKPPVAPPVAVAPPPATAKPSKPTSAATSGKPKGSAGKPKGSSSQS